MGDYVLDALKTTEDRLNAKYNSLFDRVRSLFESVRNLEIERLSAQERDDLCEKFDVPECVFDFGTAIGLMKMGRKVRRKSWYPESNFVSTDRDNAAIFFNSLSAFGNLPGVTLWQDSHQDILAEDWEIVK